MIEKFENIISKSFENYTSKDLVTQINIIFGMNGSGKTAFSNWLHEKNKTSSRMFCSDYVNENIKLDDSEKINGVKIIVGKKDLEFLNQIKDIENANENIKNSLEKYIIEKEKIKNELYILIDNELLSIKSRFKEVNIRHKSNSKSDPLQALENWSRDVDSSLTNTKYYSSNELNTQRKFLEQKEKKLIPVCESFTKERFLKLNKSLEKTIIPPMENYTTNLLKWLEDGLDIHNLKSTDITEKGTCEFCGNEFITDEIINTIENKIDTEYSQLIRAIDKIISELPQKDITKLFTDELDSQVLLDFNNAIDFLRELLENKRYNTMSNLNFPTELIEKFLILDISILKKKQEYQFEIVSIDKKLNRLELYAKHLVGKNLEQNPKINELKYQIPELDHMTSISQKAIEGNEIKIKEWNEIDSDYSNFKDIVNQELDRLGLEFRLELLNNDLGYKIKHINSKIKLKARDLSEGERRLLSFLYFYYNLFEKVNKEEQKIDSSIDTIIIDDPITSFDADNRFFLIERINHFINNISQKNVQIFLLTHSSFDFHSFAYNYNSSKKTNWKINKDISGKSQIEKVKATELKNYSDYYRNTFSELADFSLKSKTDVNKCTNYTKFGNQMRFVLESNARTNYDIENVTSKSLHSLTQYYSIPDGLIEEFKNAINLINSLSHGRSYIDDFLNGMTAKQLQIKIRIILQVLYLKDSYHVQIMTNYKLNKTTVGNWNIIKLSNK